METKAAKTWMERLTSIGSYIVIFTTIIGGYIAVDNHYAKADALRNIEVRFEQKILQDRQDRVQERLWKIEDQLRGQRIFNKTQLDEKRRLEKEFNDLDQTIHTIQLKEKK